MTVHINGSKGKELYYNGVKIKEAYYNGNKVYSSSPLYYCYKYTGNEWYVYTKENLVHPDSQHVTYFYYGTYFAQATNSSQLQPYTSSLNYNNFSRYQSGDLYT